jgi:hypothetical protein
MKLIAMRPDVVEDFFYLWFISVKGTIFKTHVMNIEDLSPILKEGERNEEVTVFDDKFTPNYISNLLKKRNE